ncbi:MAG: hypothetical protein CBD88_00900 [Flavobacteriales bacterium TMED228]|nr:MAG: hypothetical protein CBD88_00900 [Flavobacteriales bacterium TMED228]
MIIEGIAYWASVTSPNTTYEPVYTVNLVISDNDADRLRSEGIKVVDKEEGPTVVIKRKVNGPNNMIRRAPKLIDRNREPLDCKIGNGSKVKIQYKPWEVERQGTTYKGLDFQGMQVLNLVTYNMDGDEFEDEGDDEEMEL